MEFGRVPIKLVNKSYLCSAGNLRAITVCLWLYVCGGGGGGDGWVACSEITIESGEYL